MKGRTRLRDEGNIPQDTAPTAGSRQQATARGHSPKNILPSRSWGCPSGQGFLGTVRAFLFSHSLNKRMARRKEPREGGWGQEREKRGTGRARNPEHHPGGFPGKQSPLRPGFPLFLSYFISPLARFCPRLLLPAPWGGFGRAENSRGAAGRRGLQYKEPAADGDLYPRSPQENRENQRLPPRCEAGLARPGGLGRELMGTRAGRRRCHGAGEEEREEPQGSAPEPDFPTGRKRGKKHRQQERGEGLRASSLLYKQTVGSRASACTPRPLQKRCKITERLLIFNIFVKTPGPGVMRMQQDVSFQLK